MRLDKTTETFLIFAVSLFLLLVLYKVEGIAEENSVASKYEEELSLTGARLSQDVYASMEKKSEWESNGLYGAEYDFTIYNVSSRDINNWKITLDFPSFIEMDSYWNFIYNIKGKQLILLPEYHNAVIEAGSNLTFGMVMYTPASFSPVEINFVGYRTTVTGGSAARKIIICAMIIWAITFVGFFVTKFNLRNYREKQKNDVKIILQSMNTFIRFIDAKDPYTRGHSTRVAMYAAEIAKRMGLPEDEVQNIYYAGLLHDAGKISIPDAVLNKPGKLSDEERKLIQNHTVAGGQMLKQLYALRGVRETALYHHERYDGKGYPEGLKGEVIPLYARIVGVADAYDAMSSDRVYRRHRSKDEIIKEIQDGAGGQFDPSIVPFMIDMINDGYVNIVKIETYEHEENVDNFRLTENDIPSIYMGF